MFDHEHLLTYLGYTVVALPTLLLALLGVTSFITRPFSERVTGALVQVTVVAGFVVSVVILALMLPMEEPVVAIKLGNWVEIQSDDGGHATVSASHSPAAAPAAKHSGTAAPHDHEHFHYHFAVKFVFDRLSVPFVILTFLLCGTIGKFAIRYMHREQGFNRFMALYSLFMLGMIVTSLAGTIETLFAGWELVGLSSALLVAFYHERPAPVRNGLRVWVVYRISDAALLFASVALHHMAGGGDFSEFLGREPWPVGITALNSRQALLIGSLLVVAAAGKSAMVPFSGWLPRAMEGPTPSSAVFYGALSVHLGAFLLLRAMPLLELSTGLSIAVVLMGLTTSIFSSFTGRVQTDIKSALSFASLTQVGFITAEIGIASLVSIWIDRRVGDLLCYFALFHILGHGCLRTLQFVRAPSLLHDYKILENAIGDHLPHKTGIWDRVLPARLRVWFYRLAMERGYLDACLDSFFVAPLLTVFRFFDRLERRWTDFLSGSTKDEPNESEAASAGLEDMQ